jgi:hypothetical protein
MAAHTAQQKEGHLTAFWANISDAAFPLLFRLTNEPYQLGRTKACRQPVI